MEIRTRFAPSPTGSLHLGGARTAIFNWLFSRHNNGEFVLRIEDTDRARSTEESLNEIYDSLKWLGINWDGEPVKQSDRLDIYREYANKLIRSGKAYKCFLTPEELEEKRRQAQEQGKHFRYKREWAGESSPEAGKPYTVRLVTPEQGTILVNDLLRGSINFDPEEIEDFIILKTDGYPTYNFAAAVDDALMEITHIIRGDDHLINTPRQMLIYDSLGLNMPQVAHVSMIFGEDKTKLSKRHGAVSVSAYRKMGYLPEAMINYLARLGWSYGDQEIFTKDELIDKFTLKNVGKSPAVFNPEKLSWLNSHYIKNKPDSELAELLIPLYRENGIDIKDQPRFLMIVEQLKQRSKTLNEFVEQSGYFFTDEFEFNEKDRDKFLNHETLNVLILLRNELSGLKSFTHDEIHECFKSVMEKTGLKLGKIAQPARVALTGGTVSPGIFDVIEILGKESTIKRIDRAIGMLSDE